MWDIPSTGEHEFERTLASVEARLPDDVRVFAATRCRFVAVGADVQAQTLPPPAVADHWTIVVREEETREAIIAHEIAHACLGHLDNSARAEEEAWVLAESWGFSRPTPR